MKLFLVMTLVLGSMGFFHEEEGLIIVTENNINDVLKTFEYIMVMFYAPFD